MFEFLGFNKENPNKIKARSRTVIHVTTKLGKLNLIDDYRKLNEVQRAELKSHLMTIIEQL